MNSTIVAVVSLVALAVGTLPDSARAGVYANRTAPGRVIWHRVEHLSTMVSVNFRTSNSKAIFPNADPAMHIFDANGNELYYSSSTSYPMAGPSYEASISFTPSVPGPYFIMVRPQDPASAGITTLLQNGVAILTQEFGGSFATATWSDGDIIRATAQSRAGGCRNPIAWILAANGASSPGTTTQVRTGTHASLRLRPRPTGRFSTRTSATVANPLSTSS